jgi:hypothetical protein
MKLNKDGTCQLYFYFVRLYLKVVFNTEDLSAGIN